MATTQDGVDPTKTAAPTADVKERAEKSATTITRAGVAMQISGALPEVNKPAPDFSLIAISPDGKLSRKSLKHFSGKYLVLYTVPAINTPTCGATVQKFNSCVAEKPEDKLEVAFNKETTVVVCVSRDHPETLRKFRETNKLRDVILLSAMGDSGSVFGDKDHYGVSIQPGTSYESGGWEDLGSFARAAVVVDPNGKIIHTELVKELKNHPNFKDCADKINANASEKDHNKAQGGLEGATVSSGTVGAAKPDIPSDNREVKIGAEDLATQDKVKRIPMKMAGPLPQINNSAPAFSLTNLSPEGKYSRMNLENFSGKYLVLYTVPSIDLERCGKIVKSLDDICTVTGSNPKAMFDKETTVVVCVSKDHPSTLKKFREDNQLKNVMLLSAMGPTGGALGNRDHYGVTIQPSVCFEDGGWEDLGSFAGAVVVISPQGKVIHHEIGTLPNFSDCATKICFDANILAVTLQSLISEGNPNGLNASTFAVVDISDLGVGFPDGVPPGKFLAAYEDMRNGERAQHVIQVSGTPTSAQVRTRKPAKSAT